MNYRVPKIIKQIGRIVRAGLIFGTIAAMVYLPVGSGIDLPNNLEKTAGAVQGKISQLTGKDLKVQPAFAALDTRIYLATISASPWDVPLDWNDASNSIEVIGGGGGGAIGSNAGAGGGGGGAYARSNNINLTEGGTAGFSVGAGGAVDTAAGGGNTWFCSSNTSCANYTDTNVVVSADGGGGATTGTAGSAGDTTGITNAATEFAGGNGGSGSTTGDTGGGGGGAGGPGGAGKIGGNGPATTGAGGGGGGGSGGGSSSAGGVGTGTQGGAGGNGYGGSGGGTAGANGSGGNGTAPGAGGGGGDSGTFVGGNGAAGQEWDSTHGSGGGGGGAANGSVNTGKGANYGGGGGGSDTAGTTQLGGDGIIVITYRPITEIIPTAVGTQTASIDIPASTTNTYIGGAFKLTTTSTTTVTSIAVTASTSTGAVTGLNDVKLYWDEAASCDTANPITSATLFNTASANFSALKATISGSTAVTAGTPKCFYPTMDVGTTVTDGLRFDIKIQAATDIVTAITEAGTYPVEITGKTTFSVAVPADPSWVTGAADFEIWAGATSTTDAVNTWDNGTLICSTSLNDDNTRQSTCGSINKNQKYRIQSVLKNVGGTAVSMAGGDFVDQMNVKTFWAGTSPTISAVSDCGFADGAIFGASNDDTSPTCNVAFSGNNVRITNTTGSVVIAATTGTEGFMYLLTTDSNVPLSDSSTYMNASIDAIIEDSSRVTIGSGRRPGIYIRGGVKIRGKVKFR